MDMLIDTPVIVLSSERVTGKRLWSGPWLEPRKAFQWEVRHALLGKSLSHCSITVGLDEQRQSVVLELYCRKAGERERGEREKWGKV